MTRQTMFEKIWRAHEVVPETVDTPAVVYVDLHLTHEVTSPQAFAQLAARRLKLRRPACYEDIAEILTGAGFATSDYASQIERIVKVRNMLIHGYNGIDPHALHNQLGPRIMELELFASQATSFVRRVD